MGGRRRRKGEVQRLSNNIRLKKRGKEKESKKWGRRRGGNQSKQEGEKQKRMLQETALPSSPSSLPASLFLLSSGCFVLPEKGCFLPRT